VHEKKLEGIRDIRDESTKDIRVVIELKNNANAQTVLNYLYKHTQLEETFHYNVVALVDGVPQTLSLKAILEYFVAHRKEVVTKRTKYDLAKAETREHILARSQKALDHIDEIIALIKKSKDVDDARKGLMRNLNSPKSRPMRFSTCASRSLPASSARKIEDEFKEVQALIEELPRAPQERKEMMDLIKKEIREVVEKFGDDRRTKIVKRGANSLGRRSVADEDSVLVSRRAATSSAPIRRNIASKSAVASASSISIPKKRIS
jgi:DNA gyrase subunit A